VIVLPATNAPATVAVDVQRTFSAEWARFPDILPEHEHEFRNYFDIVDLAAWRDARVMDAGCGIGRWAFHLAPHCRELVLVDFSEAIFVARRNLRSFPHVLYFRADIEALPFRPLCADAIVSLGVLHHLPTPALDAVRRLSRYAPELLVYLYYALDNRPRHYRVLLSVVTMARRASSRIENERARGALTWLGASLLYEPLIMLGRLADRVGLARHVPLFETYGSTSFRRLRQDVYDRFFTRIEQRFSRRQIQELHDTFAEIVVSDGLPYWHFLCKGASQLGE
jgi:SAM-dependent methyltransferase